MTLEDFFTLTEMKDGLSSLGRVDELVSTMKKENTYSVKNFSDAARQWSTVAAILAATENVDCLNHFIRLEGLCFLDQWLQEAQRCNFDANGESSVEAINALLGALEKLPINREKTTGSALGVTIRHLFAHQSLDIQRRAKNLLEGWLQVKETGKKSDMGKDGIGNEVELKNSIDRKIVVHGGSLQNSMPNAFHPSSTHTDSALGTENQQLKVTNSDMSHNKLVGDNNKAACQTASLTNSSCAAVLKSDIVAETSSAHSVEGLTSAGSCVYLTAREGPDNKPSDVPEPDLFLKERTDSGATVKDGSSCKSSVTVTLEKEDISVSSTLTSLADIGYQKTMDDATANKLEADSNPLPKKPSVALLNKNDKHEFHSRNKAVNVLEPKSEGERDFVHSASCSGDDGGAGPRSFSTEAEAARKHSNEKGSNNDADMRVKPCECVSASIDQKRFLPKDLQKELKESDGKQSEMGVGYDVDDGVLECARQVVKDLEKEVGAFKESLVHFHDNEDHKTVTSSILEQPSTKRASDRKLTEVSSSSSGQTPLKVLKPTGKEADNQLHEHDSSQSAAAEQELDAVPSRCVFDLNEDVDMEESELPKAAYPNQPIKVIAASKGAAGLPITPLHFEGELGWKGTAATSAFRPASPRKAVEVEKVVAGSHSSKPSQNVLKIDLNVAEEDVDGVIGMPTGGQILFTSSLRPGNSSEVSSKRAERLNLDLNRSDGEDGCPHQSSDWKRDRHMQLHQNEHHFSSSASSSSWSRQPAMRNIDLNDNPSFLDSTGYDQQKSEKFPFQPLKAFSDSKLDDPVISIMGSKIGAEKKDFPGPTQPFFVSGRGASVFPIAANTGRFAEAPGSTTVAYTSQLPFAYNGLSVASPMSLSSALYAPAHLPYIVDARGATVIPEILNPMHSSFSRTPFFMSMTNAPSGMNGIATMRPGLDLNSGMPMIDQENREGSSLPLFVHSYSPLMDEKMKSATQQVGASASLKRKEPEGGWEPYAGGFKQVPPWHA